jgi:hypothetical protein
VARTIIKQQHFHVKNSTISTGSMYSGAYYLHFEVKGKESVDVVIATMRPLTKTAVPGPMNVNHRFVRTAGYDARFS